MYFNAIPDATVPTPRHALRYVVASILFGLAAGASSAQSMTPAQFVAECANNPGNQVNIAQQTKFQTTFTGTTFSTPTACNVVLAPGASLEFDTITMNFGGPFSVRGSTGGKVVLDKTNVSAPSIDLQLTGFEGQLQINESRLQATVGDLDIAFGEKGKMEINQSGAWYQPRVSAKGVLAISAGASFSGTVLRSGLQGAKGIDIELNGFDSGMKFETVDMLLSSGATSPGPYTTGSLMITGLATKVAIEMNGVNVMEASQDVDIDLTGAESKLAMKDVRSQTGSAQVFLGATGEKGEVMIENSRFFGNPNVEVRSGVSGKTEVINATSGVTGGFSAVQAIIIGTGAGGACNASSMYMNAPTMSICR
jgi:hypothetical protein